MTTGALLLLSIGMRFRVGRLLAGTREVSIAEALEFASQDLPWYIRVSGRITSDEEFPDENDRPLVYRRKRIEIGGTGTWRTIADEREAVPFGVETRGTFIAVDEAVIADGLVAIPRESVGVLSDLPKDLLEGVDNMPSPTTPARLVIEQLSAVEHATVCGVAVMREGRPMLTRGKNARPLIVTTLDQSAAMRVLAADHRLRVRLSGVCLVLGLALLACGVVTGVAGL